MNTRKVVRAALSLGFGIQGWPSLKRGQEALCFVVDGSCLPGGSAAPAGLVFLLCESWGSTIKGSDSPLPLPTQAPFRFSQIRPRSAAQGDF